MTVLESRINAIIALKHILALVTPLRAILSNANNPLMRGLYRAMDDPNFEILLNRIHHVIDDQVKPSKGRIGMLKERCRAVKPRINDILDLARQTYRDMVLSMEGSF
jgi:DNA mismatch repair protein MSH4